MSILVQMREYSAKSKQQKKTIRTDAEANRTALVLAARKMFELQGAEISLAEVAKKARVSRPTLYRNFKDKGALVAAVFEFNISVLEKYAQKIGEREDAFFRILEMTAHQQAKFQSLMLYFNNDKKLLVQRLVNIFEQPVKAAKDKGSLRQDFDIQKDLILLIAMLGISLVSVEVPERKAQAKRAMQLLLEGIKTKK